MLAQQLFLIAVLCAPLSQAQETILGVYIFSRHGDRTAKMTPPSSLTDLGYQEVFTSGTYFRNRYISSSATSQIAGIEPDVVKQSQIIISAPYDPVLMPSSMGFSHGLYPPVGDSLGSQTLRNGTNVTAPLNGFQIIPVQELASSAGSESSGWLQGATGCANAETSSNEYFLTPGYMELLNSTSAFYKSLTPIINGTFSEDQISFHNAYTIFDLLNVASIHNATINSSNILTPDVLAQTRTLADTHEYNLAYNSSDQIRAVAGASIAAQIVQALNTTVAGMGKSKLNIQFGAYGGFQSFFGLAQLPMTNPDFYGVPDYASTMTFELFTNGSATPFPAAGDINVRFLFHNGTTSNISEPVAYPLFGQQSLSLPWADFVTGMNKFAIGTQQAWCTACGNSTGSCAPSALSPSSSSSSSSPSSTPSASSSHGNGISTAVGGVIGAMVTLAVILGAEAVIMLLGGLRLVSKKRLVGQNGVASTTTATGDKAS
ncbi:MAG: hypothetical protein M1827_003532 [Pycnora praestabilis]|nr:MAG: hypothetical protein M1827_003532 [Pycnora praestabilis]